MMVLKGKVDYAPAAPVRLHRLDLEKMQRRSAAGIAWHLVSRLMLRPLLPRSGFVWQGMGCGRLFEAAVADIERQSGRFDLILVRGQGAFEMLWTVRDPRLWRVVESAASDFKGRLGRWLRHCLYHDHRLICVSNGVRSRLLEQIGRHRTQVADCRVVYNAVPMSLIRTLAKKPCAPDFNEPYLVHVARLVPVKQQPLLLEAYALARQKGLDLPLVIIGDGSERSSLQALARRLDIASRVHFLGQQDNPYPWVAKAQAFVLSSRTEGLGLVLIEALALGTQCVATDVPGGIREVLIDEQRRLLAENRADSLADKILEAVQKPVRVDDAWLERFSEPNIIRQYLSLIPPLD
ncbi:N-acetylgalactosamine-N,N'-diacetylbacillosaminyl-diphospho-undecaprenol 4-alpha-N-acetylgalactosaminyltransferase [Oceanimonas sp. MB9]|nr:N-acetylgalactosamine-N,N'-diacetylbacillosaminyl-diphospho-undecaprenol 4-alpha-N-acetylgalactosaminyltransferase [Oceanimonas sp. MB9]